MSLLPLSLPSGGREDILSDEASVPAAEHGSLRGILVACDATGLAAGWSLTLFNHDSKMLDSVAFLTIIVLAGLLASHWQGLYRARTCLVRSVEVSRVLRVGVVLAAVAGLIGALGAELQLSPMRIGLGALGSSLVVTAARGAYRSWLSGARKRGRFLRRIVVVGTNSEAHHLATLLTTHPETGYAVVGVIGDQRAFDDHPFEVARLGDVGDTLDVVRQTSASGAIVAGSAVTPAQLNALVRRLLERGVHVQLSSGIQGISHTRLKPSPLAHEPLVYVEPLRLTAGQAAAKRLMDVVISGSLLLLALPVLGLAAFAIKLDSRGPALFRQRRPGRNEEPFEILKLRTMTVGAERLEPVISDALRGPRAKVAVDARRTRVGRILERTSVDELPQLLNVLRGDMSIVGPRPALLHEAERFDSQLKRRHTVRPGITGLWQVEARDNPAFDAYRRYDLFYIENWSFTLDLAILLATVRAVGIRAAGALPFRQTRQARSRKVVID